MVPTGLSSLSVLSVLVNAPCPHHGRARVDPHLMRGRTGHPLPRSAARDGSTNGLLRAGAKEGRIGPGGVVMAGGRNALPRSDAR